MPIRMVGAAIAARMEARNRYDSRESCQSQRPVAHGNLSANPAAKTKAPIPKPGTRARKVFTMKTSLSACRTIHESPLPRVSLARPRARTVAKMRVPDSWRGGTSGLQASARRAVASFLDLPLPDSILLKKRMDATCLSCSEKQGYRRNREPFIGIGVSNV